MNKILCICERGNSRSVALAYLLKDGLNQDAIAMGIHTAGDDTKEMLYQWAESIILVDKRLEEEIPEQYHHKMVIWDVGPDRYFLGFHPDLLNQYQVFIQPVESMLELS